MKPIIGISANYKDGTSRIADAYVQAVVLAGGTPLLVPVTDDEQTLAETVRQLDGLILSGGADIDPKYFGEKILPECGTINAERDTYDLRLTDYARRYQTPILGICRGMQILNVQMGGSLFQDIDTQSDNTPLRHDQGNTPRTTATHQIDIDSNTKLAKIVGTKTLGVNSFHHQAVKKTAPGLRAAAFAADGICEAVESADYPIIGVQWHPENLAVAGHKEHRALFEWIVSEAQIHHEAQQLHNEIIALDSHCDTPMVYTEGMNFGQRNADAQVDFVKMDEGRLDTIFMAAYIPQKELNEHDTAEATKLAFDKLQLIGTQTQKNAGVARLAFTADDIEAAKHEGRKAVVPAVENGYAIGTDLANIKRFGDMGVCYITLCHNGDNLICDSALRTHNTHGGISPFGRQVVAEMNRLGIMVDLSHANETSFWDAIDCSAAPIICSHSSARTLCDHPRNLTDKQLKALAEKGGVCQICLYDSFLTADEGTANVQTAADHIDHIVQTAGIDCVGIGSDFDGGGSIAGCRASNELVNITKELLRRGYTHNDIRKIWGGNMLRVMRQVQQLKTEKTC